MNNDDERTLIAGVLKMSEQMVKMAGVLSKLVKRNQELENRVTELETDVDNQTSEKV